MMAVGVVTDMTELLAREQEHGATPLYSPSKASNPLSKHIKEYGSIILPGPEETNLKLELILHGFIDPLIGCAQ